MTEPKPTYRRWVGSLLSLMLPGAGIYLAGDKKTGLRWFFGLMALWLTKAFLAPLPAIPGVIAYITLLVCTLLVVCWMLARSYRPVPRIKKGGWIVLLLVTLVFAVSKLNATRFLVRPFKMPTGSMEPTVQPGDTILVQPYAYWFSKPQRGDIVVFKTDDSIPLLPKEEFYVKRVAGLPGELIEIKDGRLFINGEPLTHPAVLAGNNFAPQDNFISTPVSNHIGIANDNYFIVGDNPTNSLDSRHFGPIPSRSIYGKVTKIVMPLNRAGDVR